MIRRAEKGKPFYFIDNLFWICSCIDYHQPFLDDLWNSRNYFLSEQDCGTMYERFVNLIDEFHPEIKGWRAEKGGTYYFIFNVLRVCEETEDDGNPYNDAVSRTRHKFRNYFPTKEIAEEMLDKFQALLKEHKGEEI